MNVSDGKGVNVAGYVLLIEYRLTVRYPAGKTIRVVSHEVSVA